MSNGLDVALMKDPYGHWNPEQGDCHTDIAFSEPEWGAFFFDTLGAKVAEYIDGESHETYNSRRLNTVQDSLKEYPLLSRIDEFYRDAFFQPAEIPLLESELEGAAQLALDADAKAFLDGMRSACERARTGKMGIRLLSS